MWNVNLTETECGINVTWNGEDMDIYISTLCSFGPFCLLPSRIVERQGSKQFRYLSYCLADLGTLITFHLER